MAHIRKRYLFQLLKEALSFSSIVGVMGHRQVGKTTLIEGIGEKYYTLDRRLDYDLIAVDPELFLSRVVKGCVIDEAQILPTLFPALKEHVRKNKIPGQFLLSGSVRFTSRKSIQESLTGRIINLELLPLSITEMNDRGLPSTLNQILSNDLQSYVQKVHYSKTVQNLFDRYQNWGGLPGLCFLRKRNWFEARVDSSLETILDRDLRLIFPTTLDFRTLLRFLEVLAIKQGVPISFQEISGLTGISVPTVKKLIMAFESLFLIRSLRVHGKSGSIIFFEDPGEGARLHQERLDPLNKVIGAFYANIRCELAYRSGDSHEFFQYRTRGGAIVHLALRIGKKHLGFVFTNFSKPTQHHLASAQSFQREFKDSRIVFVHSENFKEILDANSAILPISSFF